MLKDGSSILPRSTMKKELAKGGILKGLPKLHSDDSPVCFIPAVPGVRKNLRIELIKEELPAPEVIAEKLALELRKRT